MVTADFSVSNNGSVWIVTPQSEAFKTFLEENVSLEGWQRIGKGFAMDHRVAAGFVEQMVSSEGFTVSVLL
jgi:hypothetical protein